MILKKSNVFILTYFDKGNIDYLFEDSDVNDIYRSTLGFWECGNKSMVIIRQQQP